jgi:peptidoglycan/LPS O-acetylase OafA/YrhL
MSTPPASGTITQAGERRSTRVESLRAVAAVSVLWDHAYVYTFAFGATLAAQLHPSAFDRLMLGAHYAVFLFFALTGYLLFWPFAREHLGGGDSVDLGRYALNRAVRILPLYLAAVVILLLVKEGGGTAEQWWRFVTLSQNFSQSTVQTVDGPMWSLVVEVHFYVLLPFLAYLLATVANGSVRRCALALAAVAAVALYFRYAEFLVPRNPSDVWKFSLPVTFWFFIPGMALALVRLAWREGPPPRLTGWLARSDTWVAGGVALWIAVAVSGRVTKLDPLIGVAAFLVVGACVLPLRPGLATRALEWRPLAVLGVASYSLYIWHAPILDSLISHLHFTHSFGALMAVGLPLAAGVALLSYRLVEAPFLRLRRQWSRSAAPKTEGPGTVEMAAR